MESDVTLTIAGVIKDYGPPVAWIVAVFGLYFNNVAANTREKRKEFRSEIDAVEKLTKEVVSKLNAYFKLTERNDDALALEVDVKVLFREIGLKWDRMRKRQSGGTLGLYVDPCTTALDKFYDSATGAYFETAERLPPSDRQNHVHAIHIQALQFVESLHALFLKKFDQI